MCACFHAPSANLCPHLGLHSFREGGVSRIKECVYLHSRHAVCRRGSSPKKKKMSEVNKENEDKSFIVGLVGERACLNRGVGEN